MSDDLLRLALEQTERHALILLDRNGVIVSWLMGAPQIVGYGAAEMVGGTIDCLFTPEDCDRGVPATELATASRHGRAEDDRWMLRNDGIRFWANGYMECVRNKDGALAGFSKMLRDRTDLRGQIETLVNRADMLGAYERRTQLVQATLAHELRNPLGVLKNAAELIDMATPRDANLTYASQLVTRQTKYIGTLVEDLLELARAQAGKVFVNLVTNAAKLGLSIVKEYVELHGGSVQVRSEGIGRGSEFIVRLPLNEKAPVWTPGRHAK